MSRSTLLRDQSYRKLREETHMLQYPTEIFTFSLNKTLSQLFLEMWFATNPLNYLNELNEVNSVFTSLSYLQ